MMGKPSSWLLRPELLLSSFLAIAISLLNTPAQVGLYWILL
jgi:hypothetical protein